MVESPSRTTEESKHPPLRGPSPIAEEREHPSLKGPRSQRSPLYSTQGPHTCARGRLAWCTGSSRGCSGFESRVGRLTWPGRAGLCGGRLCLPPL